MFLLVDDSREPTGDVKIPFARLGKGKLASLMKPHQSCVSAGLGGGKKKFADRIHPRDTKLLKIKKAKPPLIA